MPIYKIQRNNIANPEIKCVYSYRSAKRDTLNSMYKLSFNKLNDKKNYGDKYDFPVNYPSTSEMQKSMINVGTNMGTIPF
jgi:hypothetical protein